MLVLSRRNKESIVIDGTITVTVLEVKGDRVKLGIAAPSSISIQREEIIGCAEPGRQPKPAKREALELVSI